MMAMTTVSGKGNSDDDDDDDERRLATSGREQCWLSNSTIQYEQSRRIGLWVYMQNVREGQRGGQ